MMTRVKTDQEIADMRISGRMLAQVLEHLRGIAKVGVSTLDLSYAAADELKRLGGKPAFQGYQGFPEVLCTSVNDTVVHGIPSKKIILKDGDVVGLDFGVVYNGMITDAAITVAIGEVKPSILDLMRTTEEALNAGIFAVIDRVRTGDIAAAVQAVLERKNYGIVRDLVGHGVGHRVHEEPNIPNYGNKGTGKQLFAGMTIAIEPMSTLSGEYRVFIDNDGWGVKTMDKSTSAHFEHTVLITEYGSEILTTL